MASTHAQAHAHERQPLLETHPHSTSSTLNPLATSFSFTPHPRPPSHPHHVRADSAATAITTTTIDDASSHDPWVLRHAHAQSPHTPSYFQPTDGGSTADSDSASILPSRRAFRRAHLISSLTCVALYAGVAVGLTAWRKEVRWIELGLGSVGWLASESVKDVVFDTLTRERVDRLGRAVKGKRLKLPTAVHALAQELLRLAAVRLAVALLPSVTEGTATLLHRRLFPPLSGPPRRTLPPLDTLFFSALWIALGWALVESLWASRDLWRRMQLYDDVLEDEDDEYLEDEEEGDEDDAEEGAGERGLDGKKRQDEAEALAHEEVEEEMERSYAVGAYGATPLVARHGPGFVASSRLGSSGANGKAPARSLGLGLDPEAGEVGAEAERGGEEEGERRDEEVDALLRAVERDEVEAQLGIPLYEIPVFVVFVWRLDSILLSVVLTLLISLPFRTTSPSLFAFSLEPTFALACATHVFLSLLWVSRVRHVGIPSVSYATLVILVALTFAVLGAWGALD